MRGLGLLQVSTHLHVDYRGLIGVNARRLAFGLNRTEVVDRMILLLETVPW